MENVVILGDGIAGLAAAIYAARANLNPVIVTGYESGGQLMWTTDVENYPGFPEGILGPDLIENMRKQATRFGARFIYKRCESISGEELDWQCDLGDEKLSTKAIIIATGASARMLGIEAEKTYFGKGISTCATCDGAFTKDKKVIVVGGGDSAMEEANFLTKFAEHVTIVHRSERFRASQIMQERTFRNPKISVEWNSVVSDVIGDGSKVTGAILRDTTTDELRTIETDFVFYAIGHIPNTGFLNGLVATHETFKTIITNERYMTTVEGIFACGDVQDPIWRQAITAAGTGAAAAISVERYLAEKDHTA
jgi:thioredoxin reductase (NADPH)